MTKGKRLRSLHLAHRWLGVVLGLLVLLWLLSGLVMLFVARPQLDERERLATLPALSADSLRVSPAKAWEALDLPGAPQIIRLNAAHGRAAYRILADGRWWAVDAGSGKVLTPQDLDPSLLGALADPGMAKIAGRTTVHLDQWTVYLKFDPLRPFWRVELDDHRHLYISTRSGELALDTTSEERTWNWLGSVVHWIYITPLRQHTPLWRNIVLWSSLAALVLAALGLWLGVQRLRVRQRYSGGRITPYRTAWKRWHHLLGLSGGVILLTWLLSGWLSLAPFGLAAGPERPAELGSDIPLATQTAVPTPLPESRELEWARIGTRLVRIDKGSATTRISLTDQPHRPALTLDQIEKALGDALRAPITRIEWLDSPDTRYFPLRHQPRAFPVARVALDDPNQTVLYVSPHTGRIEQISNRHDQAHRWLYQGLHRLDLPIFVRHPLLRDVVIIALLLLGIALTCSGCALAWRRLFPPSPIDLTPS